LPVRHLLEALDGGLKGDSPGDFWVLGSYASKASSYHSASGGGSVGNEAAFERAHGVSLYRGRGLIVCVHPALMVGQACHFSLDAGLG